MEIVITIAALAIPEVLHVSYKFDFMNTTGTSELKAAVQAISRETGLHTIRVHSDAQCFRDLIADGYIDLAYAIVSENYPPFRSDVCRLWYLKEQGGYYFDNDMVVIGNIVDVVAKSGVSFASAVECCGGGIHNGFLAVEPHHYIAERAFEIMNLHYQHKIEIPHELVGPGALWMAFNQFIGKGGNRADVMLLQEDGSSPKNLQTMHDLCNMGLWLCPASAIRYYSVEEKAEKICDWRKGAEFMMYTHGPGSRQCPIYTQKPVEFTQNILKRYRVFFWSLGILCGVIYCRNPVYKWINIRL